MSCEDVFFISLLVVVVLLGFFAAFMAGWSYAQYRITNKTNNDS